MLGEDRTHLGVACGESRGRGETGNGREGKRKGFVHGRDLSSYDENLGGRDESHLDPDQRSATSPTDARSSHQNPLRCGKHISTAALRIEPPPVDPSEIVAELYVEDGRGRVGGIAPPRLEPGSEQRRRPLEP